MGSCQRRAILGDNLSESFTLVHWNGVKWLLWVTKLAEGRAVDSELLDNVLVSVSDCAAALLVWWRSGLTLTLFSLFSVNSLLFKCQFANEPMAPVCSWPPELIKLHFSGTSEHFCGSRNSWCVIPIIWKTRIMSVSSLNLDIGRCVIVLK